MSCPAGSTRNSVTGRCRKSCARHQARNPETGRCVTKNYLRQVQRETRGSSDKLLSLAPYGKGSRKDYRDGLVPDPSCHPRKRNIYTGYCKTPCGAGRAINPATGNCVTLNYLRRLNPIDYDTDYDDDMTAQILFTPTPIGAYDNEVSKVAGFETNILTENDLTVMRAAAQNPTTLRGVYSPQDRKLNCGASRTGFSDGMFSTCGLSDVGDLKSRSGLSDIFRMRVEPPTESEVVHDLICKNTDLTKNMFVFVTAPSAMTIPPWILDAAEETSKKCPVRLLIPNFYGVWRLLVPKVEPNLRENLVTSFRVAADILRPYATMQGIIDSRKLANDIHEAVKGRNDLHLSFAPYPEN